METLAVVFRQPGQVQLQRFSLPEVGGRDVLVAVDWSGVSTGTERLLWSGRMPPFPGLGYPLVPGYEAVGTVIEAGRAVGIRSGTRVFVPGARCFGETRALFGGSASHLLVPGDRVVPLPPAIEGDGVLLALAATAHHAIAERGTAPLPDLIVGHGALGRLLARLTVALGGQPTVWELNPARRGGQHGYPVVDPASDPRADYRAIYDVSGSHQVVDELVSRLARGGEVVLAGFYQQIQFDFPAAFLKEARFRVSAEWARADLDQVAALVASGRLALDQVISHRLPARQAREAYAQAFGDEACIKMVLDWRTH